ncbi:transcriptional regulator [Allofournierella sp.]|uniref:transcriptional regulator n=1 Tax=Allofournierella sp. TaxID=1940256 RepID=UPI003AEF7E01
MQHKHRALLKMLVTIVDRGKGAAAVSLYRGQGLHFDYLCMGLGTANSKILDYFGLSETEKDVVITLAPAPRIKSVIETADARFHFSSPGRGILFTVPLSGVSGQVPQVLCKEQEPPEGGKEESGMNTASGYALVLAVVNRGSLDTVMDAARSEGARGGTVLHARRVGMDDTENLLGFTLQPEKEVVAILTPEAQKHAIMVAINRAAGLTTEAGGILFSLPVEDLTGLQPPVAQEE